MDDHGEETWRDFHISQREKRWSMNSQRLEEIVAELMKPIADVNQSFDTDLASLLEEYLTEAGLRALDAEEPSVAVDPTTLNFTEAALLLQQSANNYGRKVDYLYQQVLAICDSLQTHMQDADKSISAGTTPRKERRRREEVRFEHIELRETVGGREAERAKPPPTLPRIYEELEPRAMVACDAPLLDYDGLPLGLLADFGVTLRLHLGVLVDELEGCSPTAAMLRPKPLVQLQAAIEAAAPPDPPPPPDAETSAFPDLSFTDNSVFVDTSAFADPSAFADTSAFADASIADAMPPPIAVAAVKALKRRSAMAFDEVLNLGQKLLLTEELRQRLSAPCEFALSSDWIKVVVSRRKRVILAARKRLRESKALEGFLGWSAAEAAAAEANTAALRRRADSDDDGFCEPDDAPLRASTPMLLTPTPAPPATHWAQWAQHVELLAAASLARGEGVEMKQLARSVLGALPPPPSTASVDALLQRAASTQPDVSVIFMATLVLANSGNVQILPGPPLALNSFSLRVVSDDERLVSAAVEADRRFYDSVFGNS